MKQECLQYANRLNTIGDIIVSASNLIKSPELAPTVSLDDITAYKTELNTAIERHKYAEESLAEVKVPFIIQNQHGKIVEWFGKFLESIRILKNSYQFENNKPIFNKSEYEKGINLQKESEIQIVALVDIIVNKLKKDC